MCRTQHCRLFTTLVLIWVVAPIAAWAQTSGKIEGTVANPSVAPFPRVMVSVKSLATGETRTVLTNQQGAFSAPELSPRSL
jgi:hypothetical protein